MLFDDRLSTVLRHGGAGEQAARTQFRQLIDLIGSRTAARDSALVDAACQRLRELAEHIPATEQSKILREPGQRLRNPALVACLAGGEPQAAAATMATARLREEEWLELIPRLPVNARGFLRHRRDLPEPVRELLKRLGVQDLVLESGVPAADADDVLDLDQVEELEAPTPAPSSTPSARDEVGALLQRINAFRQRREGRKDHPRLPLDDQAADQQQLASVDFETDAEGRIAWTGSDAAEGAWGMHFTKPDGPGLLVLPAGALRAMGLRQPLVQVPLEVRDIAGLEGDWRVDAAPFFRPADGAFMGYRGRWRHPHVPAAAPHARDAGGDRMRQVLHELRTPVNAIQGFAEIIQQQVFGPCPNAYRALAAAIGVDAARLLAGFDEVDRLAKLETGAMQAEAGEADLRQVLVETVQRLAGVLRPRSAEMVLNVTGGPFTVPIDHAEAQLLCWRLLATLAGNLAPGEVIELALTGDGAMVRLDADLPLSMGDGEDVFATSVTPQAKAITAGMFGSGFTLRLVRAEALGIGGSLQKVDEQLRLTLPALTAQAAGHSESA